MSEKLSVTPSNIRPYIKLLDGSMDDILLGLGIIINNLDWSKDKIEDKYKWIALYIAEFIHYAEIRKSITINRNNIKIYIHNCYQGTIYNDIYNNNLLVNRLSLHFNDKTSWWPNNDFNPKIVDTIKQLAPDEKICTV